LESLANLSGLGVDTRQLAGQLPGEVHIRDLSESLIRFATSIGYRQEGDILKFDFETCSVNTLDMLSEPSTIGSLKRKRKPEVTPKKEDIEDLEPTGNEFLDISTETRKDHGSLFVENFMRSLNKAIVVRMNGHQLE